MTWRRWVVVLAVDGERRSIGDDRGCCKWTRGRRRRRQRRDGAERRWRREQRQGRRRNRGKTEVQTPVGGGYYRRVSAYAGAPMGRQRIILSASSFRLSLSPSPSPSSPSSLAHTQIKSRSAQVTASTSHLLALPPHHPSSILPSSHSTGLPGAGQLSRAALKILPNASDAASLGTENCIARGRAVRGPPL